MEYVELLGNVDCCSPIWGVFSHYFFDYIFSSFLYFCEKSFLLSFHVAVFLCFSVFSETVNMYSLFFLCVVQIVQSPSISKFPSEFYNTRFFHAISESRRGSLLAELSARVIFYTQLNQFVKNISNSSLFILYSVHFY